MLTSPSTSAGQPAAGAAIAIAIAIAALAVGTLFYVFGRAPGGTLIPLPFQQPPGWSPVGHAVPVLGALPSLLHVFAFGLLSAAAIGLDRRMALAGPVAWLLIDATFEWLQMPGARSRARAMLDESVAPQLGDWLLSGYGTFDPLDLAALGLGAVLAAVVATHLRNSSFKESHHAQS